MINQQELKWFEPSGLPPTHEDREIYLNKAYAGFKGNEKAVEVLKTIDHNALGNYNRYTELNVALFGPAGCGKTQLIKLHNKARGLPFVEIQPDAVKSCQDIITEVAKVLENAGIPLKGENNYYELPPIDIFIDEVHALINKVVMGLLKPTEAKDGMMVTEEGWRINCRNVHWIIATTDRGRLFDAFDTRFTKINMSLYPKHIIAKIVQENYDWNDEVCELVAHYTPRVPRESLAFAQQMKLVHKRYPGSWADVARKVADYNDIDEFGMTFKRLAILKALGQGPVASKRLPVIVQVKPEELDRFILPWLLVSTEDQPSFVTVGSKGYTITAAGIEELDKRNIPYYSQI